MRLFPLLSFLGLLSFSARGQQPRQATPAEMKARLFDLLNDTTGQQALGTAISDQVTAVKVAEALAFRVYGKKQIRSERPYQAALMDGYWLVTGSLPPGMKGGVFEVVLAAKDGRVVTMTHGK